PLRLFTTSHANDRALPSFPTRRSSDLGGVRAVPDPRRPGHDAGPGRAAARIRRTAPDEDRGAVQALLRNRRLSVTPVTPAAAPRSEEHTSELQSRENLVCRLLLEKKKK